ncbi:unnamed protein product [Urochloa humidicola]
MRSSRRDAPMVALELLVPVDVGRRGHRSWGRPRGGGRPRAQPREERASSAAASCAGERAGGDGTTPCPSPPCGAPPPGSTAVTRIAAPPRRADRSRPPRRSRPSMQPHHRRPRDLPPATSPTADHESATTGVGDGRSTLAMEPPPPPHRSCRPLRAAGRSEGEREEAPRPRRRDGKRGTAPRRSRRCAARPPRRLLPSIRAEPWLHLCQTTLASSLARGV